MLLVELTVGEDLLRLSNDRYALEHYWDAKISSISQISFSPKNIWGGYVAPSYGSIEFLPDTFEGNWPPPVSCGIKIKLASIDEATAETVFEGTAHINTIGREGIVYDLYGPQFDQMEDGVNYSGTVVSVFTSACTTLGLTIDTSAARSSSPSVDYRTSSSIQLLDNLSAIAAFFTHFFFIENGTLYLIDALADNGTMPLTEFDIFPSKYTYAQPYNRVVAEDDSVDGSYPYSDQELTVSNIAHTVTADIEAALANILTVVEMPRIQLVKPLASIPSIGQKISVTDESLYTSTDVWARVSGMVWDFENEQCVITGAGAIS